MKGKNKLKTILKIILTLSLIFVFGVYKEDLIAQASPKIEFILADENGNTNIDKENLESHPETIIVDDMMLFPVYLFAQSVDGNTQNLTAAHISININDLEYELDGFHTEQIEVTDRFGRIDHIDIWEYDRNNNELILYINENDNFSYHEIKEKTKLGMILIFVEDSSTIPDDFIISSEFKYENSQDITYWDDQKNDDIQYLEEEVKFTDLIVGDPNSGPSAELSSLTIKGDNNTYLNKTTDIIPDKEEVSNITYQDSINGLNIEYELKSSTAKVESIKLHRGGSELRVITDSKNTGVINLNDEIRISIKDGENASETYIIKIGSIIDADPDTSLKDPMETNLDNDTSGKIKKKEFTENTYTITVDYTVSEITVYPRANSELSKIDIDECKFEDLKVGEENKKTVTVTSESGNEVKHTIIIKREEPSNETEFDVHVNNNNTYREDNNFKYELDLNSNNYSIDLKDLTQTATYQYYEGFTTNEGETYKDFNNHYKLHGSLETGKDVTYTIKAKAQDGHIKLYYIIINRVKDTNVNINKIEVIEGQETYNADKISDTKYEYTINNNNAIYLLISVDTNNGQTFKVFKEGLDVTDQQIEMKDINNNDKFEIVITAQDGETFKEITLTIIKLSEEHELLDIKLSNRDTKNTLREFDNFIVSSNSSYTEYKVEIDFHEASKLRLEIESSVGSKIFKLQGNSSNSNNYLQVDFDFNVSTQTSFESSTYYIEAEKPGIVSSNFRVVVVRKAAETGNTLNNIKIAGNDVEGFNPTDTGPYSVIVDRDIGTVHIDFEKSTDSQKAKVELINNNIDGNNLSITAGTTEVLEIKVTSESGVSITYTINIIAKDINHDFNYIQIGDTKYKLVDFGEGNVLEIKEPVIYTTQDVKFYYELNSQDSKFEITEYNWSQPSTNNNRWILQEGKNSFKFQVIAGDDTPGEEYEVIIYKLEANDNKELDSLVISWGNDGLYEWDGEDNTINIRVDRDVKEINLVASILSEHRSIITNMNDSTIDGNVKKYSTTISENNNNFTFNVVAENGDSVTYTVNVTRKNINHDISNVKITIPGTNNVLYDGQYTPNGEYNISSDRINYDITELIIEVTKKDKYTRVKINGVATNQDKTVSRTVKIADSGHIIILVETDFDEDDYPRDKGYYNSHDMKINYERSAARDYRKLDTLELIYSRDGEKYNALENLFDPDKRIYYIRLNRGIDELEITGTTSNGAKIIEGIGEPSFQEGVEQSFHIVVQSEDGSTRTYTIHLTIKNDNNSVEDIKINGIDELVFLKDTYEYTLENKFNWNTKEINLDVEMEDEFATYEIKNNTNLSPGEHTIEIVGISEFGTKSETVYKITITIEKPYTNVNLDDLYILDENDNRLSFNKDYQEGVYNYQLELADDYNFNEVKVIVKLLDEDKQRIEADDIDLESIEIIVNNDGTINQDITFTIHAEGVSQKYSIKIIKDVVLSDDTSIKGVTLKDDNGNNYLTFNSSKLIYEVNVPYSINKLYLNVVSNDANSTSINKTINLIVGETIETFKIIAEDGTEGKEYTVIINRDKPSINNLLEEILITSNDETILGLSDRSPLYDFDSENNNYTLTLNESYKEVIINRVLGDSNQTTLEQGFVRNAPITLNHGINKFQIIVTPEDKDALGETYSITIKIVNSDIELENLWVDEFDMEFDKDVLDYDLGTVDGTVTHININGTISDEHGTIVGLGNKTLKQGINTFDIKIKSEDGKKELTYTITITQKLSDNNNIDDITLKDEQGNNLLNFDENIQEYNITVNSSINKVYLDAVTNHPNATIQGTGLYNLILDKEKTLTLIITAENGEINEYIIKVIRESLSTNNLLEEILITANGETILGLSDKDPLYDFEEHVFKYDITLNINDYKTIIIRRVLKEDNQTTEEVNFIRNVDFDLKHGVNNFEIIVTPEDKDKDKARYIININLLYLDNDLNWLEINNEELDITIAPIEYSTEEESVLINPKLENNEGRYELTDKDGNVLDNLVDLELGDNKVTIKIFNENDELVKEYDVVIKREKSSDNSILDVSLIDDDNNNYLTDFDEGIFEYIVDLPYDINTVTLNVDTNNQYATIFGDGIKDVAMGETIEFNYYVKAENGENSNKYKVLVTRRYEPLLEELLVNGDDILIDGQFDYYINEYQSINNQIEIRPNMLDPNGIYVIYDQYGNEINNNIVDLNTGENIITIVVTNEHGDEHTYKITVDKINSNSNLEELIVEGTNIYEEGINEYTIDNITTDNESISIEPKLEDENATYEIFDNKGNKVNGNNVKLNEGDNKIKVVVTAEDGVTQKEYIINVYQEKSSDNNIIDARLFDIKTLDNKLNFEEETLKYRAEFNYDTKTVRLRIESNPKAKVYINNELVIDSRYDFNLIVGETITVTFYVEAENGDLTEEYSIEIYRRKENEAVISDNTNLFDVTLEIPMNSVPFDFDPSIFEYEVNIPYKYEEIYIKGHPEHKGATVDNEGSYKLEVGKDKIVYLRVIAEDGTVAPKPYKITITREEPNDDTTLKDLMVEDLKGNELTFDQGTFDPDSRAYYITLDEDTFINEVNIKGTKNHETQNVYNDGNVSLKGILEGSYNTIITVTVVAESGSVGEYTIYVLHDLDFNGITDINDLSIIGDDGVSYFGNDFDKSVAKHEVIVPFYLNNTKLIVQTFGNLIYLDNENKEIEDNRKQDFVNNENVYRFKIESRNKAHESKVYEIKIIREDADNNALLDTLEIDGNEIIGFDPLVNDYVYIHPITMNNEVDVLGIAQSETSDVTGNKTYVLNEGKSKFITIVVQAQDGTVNTYSIEIKYVDSNALLGELTIYEIDESNNEFQNPVELEDGVFEYKVIIDKETKYVNIKGSAEDQVGARIRGFGRYRIGDDNLVVPIVVTSADGKEEITYLITISKNLDKRDDSDLEYIKIDNVIIENFTFNNYNYSYELDNNKEVVTIQLKTKEGNAKIYVNDEEYDNQALISLNDLKEGNNTLVIKVVAEDGKTTSYYTLALDKEVAPSLLLTILLILSLILWIITILVIIIRKNSRKKGYDREELIF